MTAEEARKGQDMNHSGTIRVEGVNNKGELTGVIDIVMEQLRREVRMAWLYKTSKNTPLYLSFKQRLKHW